jgi:predicted ferric reductase
MWQHAVVNNLVGVASRAFGSVCVGISPFLLFPATRHSVLLPTFGTSFERTLKFHKFLGGLMFACSTLHMLLMWIAYIQVYRRGEPLNGPAPEYERMFVNQQSLALATSHASRRMVGWGVGWPHGPPLAGFLAWVVMVAMVVAADFRRTHWELFLVIHMGYAAVYAMIFVHYPTTLLMCIPAGVAYAIDLILRYRTARGDNTATIVQARRFGCGVTELTITPAARFGSLDTPAQFVTIHLAALDSVLPGLAGCGVSLQHHPFSVSSRVYDDAGVATGFTLHIKDMGNDGWTHQLSVRHREVVGTAAHIDGPFGRLSPRLGHHRVAFLVCGGIGVTPMLNILQAVIEGHRNADPLLPADGRLVFVWSMRTRAEAEPFVKLLSELLATAAATMAPIEVRIFETRPSAPTPISETALDAAVDAPAPTLTNHGTTTIAATDTSAAINSSEEGGWGQEGGGAGGAGGGTWSNADDSNARLREPLLSLPSRPTSRATALPKLSDPADDSVASVSVDTLPFEPGRPPLDRIVAPDEAQLERPLDVAVYTCGPGPMVSGVVELCRSRGYVCHAETFHF